MAETEKKSSETKPDNPAVQKPEKSNRKNIIIGSLVVVGVLCLWFGLPKTDSDGSGNLVPSVPPVNQDGVIASGSFPLSEEYLSPAIRLPNRLMTGNYKLTWTIQCRERIPLVIVPDGDITQAFESDSWVDMVGSSTSLQFYVKSGAQIQSPAILSYVIKK
jgi:hypothetical protein